MKRILLILPILFLLGCSRPDESPHSFEPTGAALRAIDHPAFQWVTHETRHLRIYALAGTKSEFFLANTHKISYPRFSFIIKQTGSQS